jgi:chorismate synthase
MSFGFGKDFRVTLFGESHGKVVGAVVEGCPASLQLTEADIQQELDKRRPGQVLTTGRRERDLVRLLSGAVNGRTNGGPITMLVANEDVDSSWYEKHRYIPRPGHADYTAFIKYRGLNDYRGGGFFSGRLTAGIVMGGAIAKKILSTQGVKILTHVVQMGSIKVGTQIKDEQVEELAYSSPVRCADREKSGLMVAELERLAAEHDSTGGVVECRVLNLPVGVGEPLFDSMESVISHGIFSIPAVKAIEFGSGFRLSGMRGSEANDEFYVKEGRILTTTNNSGGILGGLTNGMPLVFRVGIKPTSSIGKPQQSVDLRTMKETELRVEGRHDPCIAVRAVPVIESMTSICITDLMVRAQMIPRIVGD